MPRWLLKALIPLLAVAMFLGGLLLLGNYTRDWLQQQDRATFPVTSINCPAPPGQRAGDFLTEVQYLAGLPERINLLDEALPEHLYEAFGKHPWVEKVDRVEVTSQGVRVRLQYRVPVLAVILSGTAADGKFTLIDVRSGNLGQKNAQAPARAIDGQGILLPAAAVTGALPVLYGPTKPPTTPPGTPWQDATVQAAAHTAALLRPYQDRLHLEDVTMTENGLVWSTPPRVRVLWGRPPGSELKDEASAAQKEERLRQYCDKHGGLDRPEPMEHDMRPHAAAINRPWRAER
jgi:hypothetical protein